MKAITVIRIFLFLVLVLNFITAVLLIIITIVPIKGIVVTSYRQSMIWIFVFSASFISILKLYIKT